LREGSREITVAASAAEVWDALVAPALREWYFILTPEGDFAEGERIRWLDSASSVLEESEIVELDAPARLVMRTRFVFDPAFASQEPHAVTWEVIPDGSGARVRMSWRSGEVVSGLLEREAEGVLKGLRLEVDPAARAELARLPVIGEVEIRDLTPERIPDYQKFFDDEAFRDYPSWQSCYCMETHRKQDEADWNLRTGADNRRDMTSLIDQGKVTALLAYADGKPVGWCNFGETTRLSGVMLKLGLKAEDHDGIGSVACFVIAAPYRGHGIATRLLDAAIERLRARGLRAVEAYPKRAEGSVHANYRGPLGMFLRAGFEPYRETERMLVVRKTL
jgi:ribosomal protein S18 acetylase RimI-like enzyme/uncharacterized protein YndB with AHSA1/START domain